MTGKFHKDLLLDDIHTLPARVYTDIAARDADTTFQVIANVDKMVRVDSPVSFFILSSIGPSIWSSTSTEANDEFFEHSDTPASPIGNAGRVLQDNSAETALEFGQVLTTTGTPTFKDLTLDGDLLTKGTTTNLDTPTVIIRDNNIELGNVPVPTNITADGGGLTILGGAGGDKTFIWSNAADTFEFNRAIATGNIKLDGNAISTLSGDLDLTTQTGGVFKLTLNAFQAGQDSSNFLEIGHGVSSGFVNSVGAGGIDFRFAGATKATFTTAGHLHLLTDVDLKHTLKIITANNLNDTGIAWENSGGSFTDTIFRTDVGANRADLVFAAGLNADIDLLTNSFKIHGGSGVEGKLEVLGTFQISSGSPGLDKILTSDANGLATWAEDLGTVVAQETFASTNARFFGELALPATQGWTDVATGSTTIDLFADTVFGESKQVIRHNDNATNGATTSSIALTLQNWTDIRDFGASVSGISRLDAVNGAAGFFVGLQADAADNPLATGNRRYGLTFADVLGNLKITEPSGTTITFDGTGGSPLVASDEFFSWECVVPIGLGAAEFFINRILTTFAPTFITNAGGLGTSIRVGSGSSGGVARVTYHDNFGVTIFEETATKTLLATTMEADVAQINIPEGKRDYIIILPDGNPRTIGATLRLAANNLSGKITLENQDPAVPEILYNGLRTLVIDIFAKEIIEGINIVNQGNVYLGFKDEDLDRAKSIFAQLSSNVDQIPTDTNPTVITYNTQDEINGIGHSTTLNPGELEILPGRGGVYSVSPQPQVGKDTGGVKVDLDMFWQIDRGSGFVDEPNSNVKITIKDADITDVVVSAFTISLADGDKIRMLQRVSDSAVGMGLKNTDPFVGPPTRPRIPSIILAMHRVGGI